MNFSTLSSTPRQKSTIRRIATEPVGLLMATLISLCVVASAATFTTQQSGKYNETSNWTPSYPGNYIKAEDTIIINAHIILSHDLLVKGILVIKERAALTSENNLIILEEGSCINNGILLAKTINNKGKTINQNILETIGDFINTGTVENHHSIVIGNIMENTGTLTGTAGFLIANKRLINTFPGKISGSVDICSNDFSNINGGAIDSINISFCGHRIFNSLFLTASATSESIQLCLKNAPLHRYKECTIEKSTDGENYTTVALLSAHDLKNNHINNTLTFHDRSPVNTNALFYRMKLIEIDGTESFTPPIEIGNSLRNGRYSISKL